MILTISFKAENEFKLPSTGGEQDKNIVTSVSRIKNTKRILDVTLSIFKQFMTEHLKIDDKKLYKYINICQMSINDCIYNTSNRVEKVKECGREYVNVLCRQLLSGFYSPVTRNKEYYFKTVKCFNKYGIIKKYCFYYDGTYICVKGKILVEWLREQMKLEDTPPLGAVIKQLKYHGLIRIVGGENTSTLYVDARPKKRHYFINADRLVEIDRGDNNITDRNVRYYSLTWTNKYSNPESKNYHPHFGS